MDERLARSPAREMWSEVSSPVKYVGSAVLRMTGCCWWLCGAEDDVGGVERVVKVVALATAAVGGLVGEDGERGDIGEFWVAVVVDSAGAGT